jgi:hypothetical protein
VSTTRDGRANQTINTRDQNNGKYHQITCTGSPLNVATYRSRLKVAVARGLLGTKPVLPGFEIKQTSTKLDADGSIVSEWVQQSPEVGEQFEAPAGQVVKGVSALVDPDGRVKQQWIKTREDRLDPLQVAEWIKQAFVDFEPAAPPSWRPLVVADGDKLTLIPLADWHIGMFAWRKETAENWDLKIAERVICAAIDELMVRTSPSGECVVIGGGDLIHSDTNENKTARSGHVLQVDGRYDKVIATAIRLLVRTIDAALGRHQKVRVRILKGNHDEHASVAVAYALMGWYRNEPRVTVDVDPSLFWWHRFGKCLFGATHGHTVKIQDMPQIMAHRRAEDWGQTKWRYVHGFHLHHTAKFSTEGGGVISEIHQAPIPQDAWHYGSGFLSGRSVQAITYHREFGEIGRARVAMMDGDHG